MKTYTDKKGYLRYKSNNRFIHRIVLSLPYNNTKFKFSECLVYHLDLNKKNNKISNLLIITPDDLSKFKSNLKINPEDTRDLKLKNIVNLLKMILILISVF